MPGRISLLAAALAGAAAVSLFGDPFVLAQRPNEVRFAAVPGEKGGQDIFGGYDVDASWPKDLTTLPGH